MADKSIAIIGAGIAGLSAGCYAQMNGYRTHIFEMHDKPGGLCTAWERKGYTIDGCLHWLTASKPSSSMYHFWEELGMVQGQKIIDHDLFTRVEGAGGKAFNIYCNIDKLEQHMLELAPEDAPFIRECTKTIRNLTRFNMSPDKARELYNIIDGFKMLTSFVPFYRDYRKWGRMTVREFAQHFKNPFLREAWGAILPAEFSVFFILVTLAWLHNKTAGYVIGGSMPLARAIEKRYLDLGGQIRYKSRVAKIMVENDRTVGVKLEDGSEHKADYVISAADGHATIFDMLDGKYVDDKIRGYFQNLKIFEPIIYVGLGVNRTFDDFPKMVTNFAYALEKPVTFAGKEQSWLSVRVFNYDSSFAPSGKTVLIAMIESNYRFWEGLYKDAAKYKAEKEHIADTVVQCLEQRFPGITSQVEMRDVATPITFRRYTGNWQGSFEGWLPTPQTINLNMSKTLPGLDNFYMVGQWVSPGGGLPSGTMTGCHAVQLLCKRDRKKFITTKP